MSHFSLLQILSHAFVSLYHGKQGRINCCMYIQGLFKKKLLTKVLFLQKHGAIKFATNQNKT